MSSKRSRTAGRLLVHFKLNIPWTKFVREVAEAFIFQSLGGFRIGPAGIIASDLAGFAINSVHCRSTSGVAVMEAFLATTSLNTSQHLPHVLVTISKVIHRLQFFNLLVSAPGTNHVLVFQPSCILLARATK
jgi:hypothetical protein